MHIDIDIDIDIERFRNSLIYCGKDSEILAVLSK
jgi:hypothetical protein